MVYKQKNFARKGAASMGLVVTLFFILFFIIVPIFQLSMEMRYMERVQNRVRTASELACMEMVSTFKTVDMSRGILETRAQTKAFESNLEAQLAALAEDVSPEDVHFSFKPAHQEGRAYGVFDVSFQFVYKSRFVGIGYFDKPLSAVFSFELPLDL